jgi:hypothetical protein
MLSYLPFYAQVSQVVSYLRLFRLKFFYAFLISSLTCVLHALLLYHRNNIWRRVQFMKLLFIQSSPASHYSSLLGPNFLLSTLISNTPSLCSALSVRDHVSHPYKTTGKIMILYILERRQEDKDSEQNGSNFNVLSVSSWMQFWLVTVLPKYLNCPVCTGGKAEGAWSWPLTSI